METNAASARDDKAVLRQKFRDLRRKFKAGGGRSVALPLESHLQKFIRDFDQPGVQFCLYRARRDEAPCNLRPLSQFFFPVVRGSELEFRRPFTEKAFQTNAMNVEEPIAEQSSPLDLSQPVVVFCPAVAIDQEGVRLGLGKGYYDRFFASQPDALRVGVVFHVQISSHPLPAESWDQAMDWIVSEKMILRINSRDRAQARFQI